MPLPKKPSIVASAEEGKKKSKKDDVGFIVDVIEKEVKPKKEIKEESIENVTIDMLKERELHLLKMYYDKLKQFDEFLKHTVIIEENAVQVLKIMKEIPVLFQTGVDCKRIIETRQTKETKARGDKSLSLLESGLLDD